MPVGFGLGRGFGDDEEEGGEEMAEMVRGSIATPMLDLVKSESSRSAGKGAGVGADAIFYPTTGPFVLLYVYP